MGWTLPTLLTLLVFDGTEPIVSISVWSLIRSLMEEMVLYIDWT